MSTSPLPLPYTNVHAFVQTLFGDDLHAKRVLSLTDGTMGVLQAAALGVRAIGQGLALAKGLNPRHATKQVDRLLSNEGIDSEKAQKSWIMHRLQGMKHIEVIADWTHFDTDNHATLMLSLRTEKGRAEPLLWKTYLKSSLKDNQSTYEDEQFSRLKDSIPPTIQVTLLADRGFFDHRLLSFLTDTLKFGYIIRIRKNIHVEDATGKMRLAREWLLPKACCVVRSPRITKERILVGAVVVVQDDDQEEPWILVCSAPDVVAAEAVALYRQRFTCEELFRDIKDLRFGMGMKWGIIRDPDRRDRMLLLATLAYHLLMLLGEAGETCGISKMLNPGTRKRRYYSLFHQGCFWYQQIPTMPTERLLSLMAAFGALLKATDALSFGSGVQALCY